MRTKARTIAQPLDPSHIWTGKKQIKNKNKTNTRINLFPKV